MNDYDMIVIGRDAPGERGRVCEGAAYGTAARIAHSYDGCGILSETISGS